MTLYLVFVAKKILETWHGFEEKIKLLFMKEKHRRNCGENQISGKKGLNPSLGTKQLMMMSIKIRVSYYINVSH